MMFKKIKACLILALVIGILFPGVSYAVPAAPSKHLLQQSDGTTFRAKQWGDEWSHGWETEDGYSIVFDKNVGDWTYATTGLDGKLIGSLKVVGRDFPPLGISKHLRPTGKARAAALLRKASAISRRVSQRVVPPTGTANIPVILINFSDTTTTYTASDFNTLLFGTDNNSMKDYYEEVSYGAFSVSAGPSGVVGWYTASNTHGYYGHNDTSGSDSWPGTLVREAVAAAEAAGFDFAPYNQDGDCYVDVVAIVHQGTGEEAGGPSTDIWSHRWDLNSAYYYGYSNGGEYTTNDACPAGGYIKVNDYVIQPEALTSYLGGGQQTMGVFTHEYGHALGLPDLYDTDYSSEDIGAWSTMAGGSWNYVSRPGDRPAHMDAWCKYKLEWVTPTLVTGTLTSEPITDASQAADVYQMLSGSPTTGGEYFLIENRQKTGFDAGLPGDGLLIWHIDEAKTNNDKECYPGGPSCDTSHYQVALEQADGLWELEKNTDSGDNGDPFPGSTGNTSFTDTTNPNSNLYNGTASNVSVTDISSSGSTMTTSLSVGGLPSCPSLYFWNGNDFERRGFIFPGAMPRENEYRDHILLNQLVLKGGKYLLQIRETEPEHSFLDIAELIIVDHSSNIGSDAISIFREPLTASHTSEILYKNKSYVTSGSKVRSLSPVSATHSAIGNVLPQLCYSDDQYVGMNPGDIITLTFPYLPLQDEVREFIFVGEGFYLPLNSP